MENSVNTSFSRREKQIADLLARGMSEKEIATKSISLSLRLIIIQETSVISSG